VCDLRPQIEHGHAVEKFGAEGELSYKMQCDPGYWFSEGTSDRAFCNQFGTPIYPTCTRVAMRTELISRGVDTFAVKVHTREGSGHLCDDGWSDREAQLICRQNGYNFGRAASLEEEDAEFMYTGLSCGRSDDYLMENCALSRYADKRLRCGLNEVAGVICYNSAFEYRITDVNTANAKKAIKVSFRVTARKHGREVDLKRGPFQLSPEHFTINSESTTLAAVKAKVKNRKGVVYVDVKAKKPKNYRASNCFTLNIRGPIPEYDFNSEEICFAAYS